MTLRKKTLLCLAGTLSVFLLGTVLVAHTVLERHLQTPEDELGTHNLRRTRNTLQTELSNLERLARDWSSWDDTYAFVENLSPAFVAANLPDATFVNLALNVLLFYDSEARLVHGKTFDLQRGIETPLPGPLLTELSKASAQLLGGEAATGLLSLPGRLMLLSCQPILTSLETGPAHGTLVMGRDLDIGELNRLVSLTGIPFKLHTADTSWLKNELRHGEQHNETPFTIRRSRAHIDGYTLFKDIYDKPSVVLQVHNNHNFTASAHLGFHYLLACFSLAGLGLAGLIAWIIDRLVTSRLARASREGDRIGDSGAFSQRLTLRGRDELSRMTEHINGMLSSLERFHHNTNEQEKLYRAVMEQSTDAIALVEREHKRLLKVNTTFREILGTSEQNPNSLTLYDVLMERPEIIDRETADFSQGGKAQLGVKLLRGENGQMLEIEFSASLVRLEGEEVLCVVGHNITELKQTQKALQSQLRFVHSLLEAIPAPVFYKDKEGVYLGVNRAFEKFLGKDKQNIVGKTVFDLAPREQAEIYLQADRELLAQGTDGSQVYETAVVAADGRKHDVIFHKANYNDDSGQPAGLIGTIVDISKNKAIETELNRERRQLFDLLDNLPAIIYVVAKDYSITFANWQFRSVFGCPDRLPCYEILSGCEPSCHRQENGCCDTFARVGRGQTMIVERQYRDGQRYQVRKYPLTDRDGTLRLLVMATPGADDEQVDKITPGVPRPSISGMP